MKEEVDGIARGRVVKIDEERGNIACAHRIALVGLDACLYGREKRGGATMKREYSCAMHAVSVVVRVQNNVVIEKGIVDALLRYAEKAHNCETTHVRG